MTLPFSLPAEARKSGSPLRGRGVTAILGPTNTGKTHLAIERMLGHDSGMIGLPLRLLAREVYQRVVEKVGPAQVALVTGEEKIKPKSPRYWISTVEAMPRDISTTFVAIDEVQMIADFERGHVFTDAMLHRRGRGETLLLGAATAQPLIQCLLPGVMVQTRPRMSQLSFAGEKKITRLPARSAIIAFSAEEVYAIAELVRRQRGGAAVVMGSLSPRTRNAQVAMFQAGEVDHIIATDAIGMGLNLDIEHVAFAADRKYDGRRHRRLFPAELAQIAGRAGRATRDGTFGTTGRCPAFDEDLVEALEAHQFEPIALAQWRNTMLDFSSLDRLETSLQRAPGDSNLVRIRKSEDETTLEIATMRPLVRDLAAGEGAVRRLWDLCQLPDYRKVSPQSHADLVVSLFEPIMRRGAIDADWFGKEIKACDRVDGDIDALSWRLAQIRTWSYCANRPDWLRDPSHWQNVTRALEDKVSDALHERLMQRFVDRRTSVLMRRLKENAMLETEVKPTGEVLVEGQHIGRLEGFRFAPDASADTQEAKTLRAAAAKALSSELETRATRLSTANDDQFQLSLDGIIRHVGEPVAVLQAGVRILEPRFLILADEGLTGLHRELVETRIGAWIKAHVQKLLGALVALEAPESLSGIGRGIAFQVAEHLGVLDRALVANDVRALDQNARAEMRKLGLRFGAHHIFVPALMKPGPRSLAAQLYALAKGGDPSALRDVSHLAFSGRTSIPVDPSIDKDLYRIAGFRVAGPRAIRVDILERLADLIRPAIAYRPGVTEGPPPAGAADGDGFVVTGAMTSLVGCAGAEFGEILKSLGYRPEMRSGPAISVPLKMPAATGPAEVAVEPAAPAPAEGDGAGVAEDGLPDTAGAPEPETGEAAEAVLSSGMAAASSDIVETAAAEETRAEETLAEADGGDTASVEVVTPAEIEIWRVARPERSRSERPRFNPRDQRRSRPGQAAPTEGAPAQPREDQPRRDDRNRAERNKRFDAFKRQDKPAGQEGRGPRPERPRPGRDAIPRPPERKPPVEKQPDPDSPFAKLAALKAQLEGKS
ncbi:helicase-related protein [Rhabdaerophilum sp. SD176]|uniref:helicase-related protein n=1 Tax=Rhabdaerophilum sp. SD176 TaxID=2983548 RepID=UPI0024E0244E|nr:helicase-related protein [Rhabdaerophilum sp. SD176]